MGKARFEDGRSVGEEKREGSGRGGEADGGVGGQGKKRKEERDGGKGGERGGQQEGVGRGGYWSRQK